VQFAAFDQLKQNEERQTSAAFLSNQANALLKHGHYVEAVESYRRATLSGPNDPKLHYNLAIALSKTGDEREEERELRRSLELDLRFAQARAELGSILLRRGRVTEAEREFQRAVADDPQSVEALNGLGTVLGRQNRNREAEQFFSRAINVDPEAPLGYVNLGLTLAAQRRYAEAEQQFQTALEVAPNDPGSLAAIGMLQGKTGRAVESVQTFRKLVALDPGKADAHLNLGIALGDSNDLEGALAEFSQAARLAPDSAVAHFNRGRVLYALHRPDDAKRALDEAVKLSPDYIDALMLLGVLEHSSPRATQLFQHVVDREPGNSQARFYLGRNLLQEGRKDEGIAQWKKAIELDPDNISALSSLVRTLAQAKSPDAPEYKSRLDALQKKQQLTDRVKELNNFALRSAEENKWEQAVSQLQEAIDLCQQCIQQGILRKNIGLIYIRKGDTARAREELQLALKLLPEGPDMVAAAKALEQLNGQAHR